MATLRDILIDLTAAAMITHFDNTGQPSEYHNAVRWAGSQVDTMNDEEIEEWVTAIFNDEMDLSVYLGGHYTLTLGLI